MSAYSKQAYQGMETAIFPSFFHGKCLDEDGVELRRVRLANGHAGDGVPREVPLDVPVRPLPATAPNGNPFPVELRLKLCPGGPPSPPGVARGEFEN